jgi:hypothetical protein
MKTLLIHFACLLLVGCSISPPLEQIKKAKFGPEPDHEIAEKVIKDSLVTYFVEANSLMHNCTKPKKGWGSEIVEGTFRLGWVIVCDVSRAEEANKRTKAKRLIYVFNGEDLIMINPYGAAKERREYGFFPEP